MISCSIRCPGSVAAVLVVAAGSVIWATTTCPAFANELLEPQFVLVKTQPVERMVMDVDVGPVPELLIPLEPPEQFLRLIPREHLPPLHLGHCDIKTSWRGPLLTQEGVFGMGDPMAQWRVLWVRDGGEEVGTFHVLRGRLIVHTSPGGTYQMAFHAKVTVSKEKEPWTARTPERALIRWGRPVAVDPRDHGLDP